MKVKLILPALTEAKSPDWRPIKYSLFPPLGLATLAAFFGPDDDVEIVDEHVEPLDLDDRPDIVGIEVYVTSARRAYAIADHYRTRGVRVLLGGLHVSALPNEAARHADHVFIGPAEQTFPQFLADLRLGRPSPRYVSTGGRTLARLPPIRRDLVRRELYLVPNSIVVSRGCPHHCGFCYKDAFFEGGRSFYVQAVDDALAEIARLPGRHLYFLDDHLLGNRRFAESLFDGMRGTGRLFQGASTVDAILRGNLIEKAAAAGLRSVFIGFESLDPATLRGADKPQNIGRDYDRALRRLEDLGVMVNGSFVFGLDGDGPDVVDRTVEWAVRRGITTATFHIATPYPGTAHFRRMEAEHRILTRDWDRYDTRQVVFSPRGMSIQALQAGYQRAYRDFYRWTSIVRASATHETWARRARHFGYTAGWKKFETLWDRVITTQRLGHMRMLLEQVLSTVPPHEAAPPVPESRPVVRADYSSTKSVVAVPPVAQSTVST